VAGVTETSNTGANMLKKIAQLYYCFNLVLSATCLEANTYAKRGFIYNFILNSVQCEPPTTYILRQAGHCVQALQTLCRISHNHTRCK